MSGPATPEAEPVNKPSGIVCIDDREDSRIGSVEVLRDHVNSIECARQKEFAGLIRHERKSRKDAGALSGDSQLSFQR
jgi:hypothetical protein